MPHAGHFIGSMSCAFHLNTCVTTPEGKRYIVSTVGEYRPSFSRRHMDEIIKSGLSGLGVPLRARCDDEGFEPIGFERFFETMVFPAESADDRCCPWRMSSGAEIDFAGYANQGDAAEGHEAMCRKWEAPQ
jgi:hypothetical protein